MTTTTTRAAKPKNKVRMSRDDVLYYILVYFAVGILTLTVLYPIIFILSSSISRPSAR